MGRWSICGSPKSLWASFSLTPSTWAVTFPPEMKVPVEGVSDSLTWGPSASRMKWGVLFLLAARNSRKWPNCFPVLHFVTFHQSTESLMAFPPLSLPICGTPSKSSSQSLKTLQIIPENPVMELLMLAHPCVCSWCFTPVSLWPNSPLLVEIIFILWFTTNLNSPPTSDRCHFWAMTLPNWVCIPFERNEWHSNFIQEQLSMSLALDFGGGRSYSQVENPCSRDRIITVTCIMYKHR